MDRINQDRLYAEANAAPCEVIRRLAKGYELDPELRRDLLQDMHIELWARLKLFDERCSLRTWVYHIARDVGASHVLKSQRSAAKLVGLESIWPDVTNLTKSGTSWPQGGANILFYAMLDSAMTDTLTLVSLIKELPLETVIGHYVPVAASAPASHVFLAPCVLHGERSPSERTLRINSRLNIYNCLYCKRSVDAIVFVSTVEKLAFPDTARLLAQRYHLGPWKLNTQK